MSDTSNAKTFIPRPDAGPTPWASLLPPVRDAVGRLLRRLDGASRPEGRASIGNFLVTGDRGTGKTTVLKTARDLCQGKLSKADPPGDLTTTINSLRKHAYWLEVLDVEPMWETSNFLTTLLVRIRGAIDTHLDKSGQVSLLEDEARGARAKLDELIEDSALIWEEIQEKGSRERAHRQTDSAEAYLNFANALEKALKLTCAFVRQHNPSMDNAPVLILPIDDIDRSAFHLKQIFKLARLVSNPHLVFVLAGDRVEIETFMLHAYWKEFNYKTGSDDAQDPRSIARRQATAAINKVIPSSHRVNIRVLRPEDALRFRLTKDEPTLEELLSQIPVPGVKRDEQSHWSPHSLREMLLLYGLDYERFSPSVIKIFKNIVARGEQDGGDEPAAAQGKQGGRDEQTAARGMQGEGDESATAQVMHEAGYQALHLPVRSLIDLWLLLRREQQSRDDDPRADRRAIGIARTMIRLLTAESSLPHSVTYVLQQEFITRGLGDSTRLSVTTPGRSHELTVTSLRARKLACRGSGGKSSTKGQEWRRFSSDEGIELQHCFEFVVHVTYENRREVALPAHVGGWLLLLHDLLLRHDSPAILGRPDDFLGGVGARVVSKWMVQRPDRHEPQLVNFLWPRPRWKTSYSHSIMDAGWLVVEESLVDFDGEAEHLRRIIALCWIDLAVWIGSHGLPKAASQWLCPTLPGQPLHFKEDESVKQRDTRIKHFESELSKKHDDLSKVLDKKLSTLIDPPNAPGLSRWAVLLDWLVHDLPLLLAPEFDVFAEGSPLPKTFPLGQEGRRALREHAARAALGEQVKPKEVQALAEALRVRIEGEAKKTKAKKTKAKKTKAKKTKAKKTKAKKTKS